MTSQKIHQYLTLTCKTPIPKLLILIKWSIKNIKNMAQSYSPVLLIFSISVPNLVTIGRHLTSFLTCATFNMSKAYAHILVFYFSAISRDIDLKFIQDTYRVVINSLKNIDFHRSKVKVTGTVHCFLKVQSYHKNCAIEHFQYFIVDTSLYALSNETIKTGASREMTSQKIRQYLTFNM